MRQAFEMKPPGKWFSKTSAQSSRRGQKAKQAAPARSPCVSYPFAVSSTGTSSRGWLLSTSRYSG